MNMSPLMNANTRKCKHRFVYSWVSIVNIAWLYMRSCRDHILSYSRSFAFICGLITGSEVLNRVFVNDMDIGQGLMANG